MGLYNNSIIIFDRGYYSEDMFRYCVEHGHLCVMRLKEGINLSKKCNGDMISILQGTLRCSNAATRSEERNLWIDA